MNLPKEVKIEFGRSAGSDRFQVSIHAYFYSEKDAETAAAEAAGKLQDAAAWLERVAAIGAHHEFAHIPPPNIVQVKNPRTGRYLKVDRTRGRILEHKESEGPYEAIPFAPTLPEDVDPNPNQEEP